MEAECYFKPNYISFYFRINNRRVSSSRGGIFYEDIRGFYEDIPELCLEYNIPIVKLSETEIEIIKQKLKDRYHLFDECLWGDIYINFYEYDKIIELNDYDKEIVKILETYENGFFNSYKSFKKEALYGPITQMPWAIDTYKKRRRQIFKAFEQYLLPEHRLECEMEDF